MILSRTQQLLLTSYFTSLNFLLTQAGTYSRWLADQLEKRQEEQAERKRVKEEKEKVKEMDAMGSVDVTVEEIRAPRRNTRGLSKKGLNVDEVFHIKSRKRVASVHDDTTKKSDVRYIYFKPFLYLNTLFSEQANQILVSNSSSD